MDRRLTRPRLASPQCIAKCICIHQPSLDFSAEKSQLMKAEVQKTALSYYLDQSPKDLKALAYGMPCPPKVRARQLS